MAPKFTMLRLLSSCITKYHHHAAGMSDARIEVVMSRLQAEASNLLGEMMLGSLIETARDVMTDINQPEGNCIYCLEGLVPAGGDPDSQAQALLRLPCYHTFHL